MAENPNLEDMGSDALGSYWKESGFDEMGSQKISFSRQPNSLQFQNLEADTFIVDMESLAHLADKETANSRTTLQRSLTRKVAQCERQINSSIANKREPSIVAFGSPRAALSGATEPEKFTVAAAGASDQASNPKAHHQITIMTGNISATAAAKVESQYSGSLRRPPPLWMTDPRKIFVFFATLSSMGTILLIYFTLSMGKLGGDESSLNW